jgi:hypothetical protein
MGHRVRVNTGKGPVSRPNKTVLKEGEETVLTDAQFASVSAQVGSGKLLTDVGAETAPGEAASPADLTAAVTTLQTALGLKEDASVAATDAEVSAVQTALAALITANTTSITANTTALTTKQDASTAATDAELATHAADSSLHSSGQRTGYAANETGTVQTITTTSTAIPSTSVALPQIARPQVLRGRANVKCSVAMTATAGTVTNVSLTIFDDLGNVLEAGMACFDAVNTGGWATVYVEADIEANAAARTYHLEINRGGSTSGTFQVLNGNIAPGFRSALRATAA